MTDIKKVEEKVAEKTVSPLFTEWNKDKSVIAQERLENNFRMLRSDAENYLGELKTKAYDAKEAYEKAKMEAKESKKFKGIAETSKLLTIADKTLQAALDCYVKEFGEQPAIMR